MNLEIHLRERRSWNMFAVTSFIGWSRRHAGVDKKSK